MKNILKGYTLIALVVVAFNVYELIIQKVSMKSGIIFIIEGLLGLLLIYIPSILKKLLKITFPNELIFMYWLFILISVFLGTCLHFISYFKYYDKLLHFSSPIVLTFLGYGILTYFLENSRSQYPSVWFFMIFGFAFAQMCGVLWEFWEFLCDQFLGLNLQRYLLHGQPLIGRKALLDTMGDLFVNTCGSIIASFYAYFRVKKSTTQYFKNFKIHIH